MPLRTPSRGRFIAPLLLALVFLLATLYFVMGLPLDRAKESWRRGRYADAMQTLESWSRLRLRPADFDNLLAVTYLAAGRHDDAKPFLQRLARRRPEWFPVIRKEEVGKEMIAAGRYQAFLEYDAAFRHRGESDEAALYRAAAQVGAGRIREAETALAVIDSSVVDPRRLNTLRSALEERKRGAFPLVLDRHGRTIASYQMSNRDLVSVNRDFEPLIEKEAGILTIEAHLGRLGTSHTLLTTLDPEVQKAAVAALGDLRGSLVAIDVTSSELLAVASTPGQGRLRNLAFEGEYEPGSVVKVLTALNAIEGNLDLGKLFPQECGGFIILNERQFFDWAKHGKVENLEEAMAISCNVVFGRMGLQLGADPLQAFMRKAGFDSLVDLSIYQVPLGRNLGSLPHQYATASYAVGLEHQRINTLHLAMLAAMVANNGRMAVPRLIRGRQSILGERAGETAPLRSIVVASEQTVLRLIPSLRAVVEHPRGTGRRAEIAGLPMAMKTGTAGKAAGGYNALIMAFAPAGSPRIAIGMIAEDSGPAEFAGAKVARDFFTGVRDRLQ